MIPSQFRLQSVAANLIERFEGTRRSFGGRAEQARETFATLAEESTLVVARECRQYTGNAPFPELLQDEIRRSFLPRYAEIAVEQTELERSGYGSWRKGDILSRIVFAGVALVVAGLFMEFAPGILKDAGFLFVPPLLFIPELRGVMARVRYRRELQSILEDMARIQKQMENFSLPAEANDPETPHQQDDPVARWRSQRAQAAQNASRNVE